MPEFIEDDVSPLIAAAINVLFKTNFYDLSTLSQRPKKEAVADAWGHIFDSNVLETIENQNWKEFTHEFKVDPLGKFSTAEIRDKVPNTAFWTAIKAAAKRVKGVDDSAVVPYAEALKAFKAKFKETGVSKRRVLNGDRVAQANDLIRKLHVFIDKNKASAADPTVVALRAALSNFVMVVNRMPGTTLIQTYNPEEALKRSVQKLNPEIDVRRERLSKIIIAKKELFSSAEGNYAEAKAECEDASLLSSCEAVSTRRSPR